MYESENKFYLDPEDQCNNCRYFKNTDCPLMQAIFCKVVFLPHDNEITVTNCKLYKEYNTTIKRIK